jgi:hypothetical protein
MLKKSLFVVAAVTLLAVAAQAGEIKIHNWPTSYIPQEVTEIPVLMDVGYWVSIKDQDKLKIKLSQINIHEYQGCTNIIISNNFELTFAPAITAATNPDTGAKIIDGDYSTWASPADLGVGVEHTASICAKILKANLSQVTGGTKDVQVATVSVRVVPR